MCLYFAYISEYLLGLRDCGGVLCRVVGCVEGIVGTVLFFLLCCGWCVGWVWVGVFFVPSCWLCW